VPTSAELRPLLILLALLVGLLSLALGGLRRVLRWLQRQPRWAVAGVFGLAYLLPWGLYLGVLGISTPPAAQTLPWTAQVLVLGQPWLYLWQMLALALAVPWPPPSVLLARGWASLRRQGAAFLLGLGLGGLAGLGYALLLAGFESRWPGTVERIPGLPPLALGLWLVTGLLLAPWVEERFFRATLLDAAAVQWGRPRAVMLSAALFALGQGRPLLLLPAFVLGLALGGLALRRGSWEAAAWAHMGVNLVLGGLAWYLLI